MRPSASSLVPRATCGSCQYITVLVAVTTSFFPLSFLCSAHDGLVRVRVSYLSLLVRSISPSQLGLLLHPRGSPLMGRSLSPRLTRSHRCLRLDLIPHIRARNRESALPPLTSAFGRQQIISAQTLLVAGSTYQTCTSCLPILRPHTSSLCPSSLMSHSTTIRRQIRYTMLRIKFSVSHNHARSLKVHVHAHQVPIPQYWIANQIQPLLP